MACLLGCYSACSAGAAPKSFEAASVEARPRSRQHQCLSLVPDKFEWKEARAGGWLVGRGRVPAGATMARQGAAVVCFFKENEHDNNWKQIQNKT